MVDVSDARLVELTLRGSADAAGELFDRYWRHAWKGAYAVVADRTVADDVAQDAMQRAFAALGRFDAERPLGPWLTRIVVNRAIDELRVRGRLDSLDEASLHDCELGDSPSDRLRLWAVADAVAALAPAKRLVVVLRYWLDFPIEDIAAVLRIPAGTVASRLSRAHDELREQLREEEHRVA
jgi:RNA polymerase sigma-70 factor (ECF subfamily)